MAATTEKKPSIFTRIGRSIKDMRGEMSRVVWPTKKQTINNSVIVVIFMVALAIVIGGFDMGLSALIRLVFGA